MMQGSFHRLSSHEDLAELLQWFHAITVREVR
jgi:hypothetical protein